MWSVAVVSWHEHGMVTVVVIFLDLPVSDVVTVIVIAGWCLYG